MELWVSNCSFWAENGGSRPTAEDFGGSVSAAPALVAGVALRAQGRCV